MEVSEVEKHITIIRGDSVSGLVSVFRLVDLLLLCQIPSEIEVCLYCRLDLVSGKIRVFSLVAKKVGLVL